MDNSGPPPALDLVLVGGGHAHVAVLRKFGMRPLPGLRITLVCPEMHTPYSGMLPGLIAGHYEPDEMHIDLRRLARFAGAAIVPLPLIGIDPEQRRIDVPNRPSLRYDLLSLNTGSTPAWDDVPGAAEHAIPVKPVSRLMSRLAHFEAHWKNAGRSPAIAVVGGGAGGVELVLALAHRLRHMKHSPTFSLYTRGEALLKNHNAGVQSRFRGILAGRDVKVHTGQAATAVSADTLTLADGREHACDAIFWTTGASAPAWLHDTGLALDARGFLQLDETLQSVSHAGVFAAGDVASLPDPRPKSGVFAVREGPVLAANLRRYAQGRTLRRFKAQSRSLALIGTGEKRAVASRGSIAIAGRPLWHLKEWIDRRFMARYRDLPEMSEAQAPVEPDMGHLPAGIGAPVMRCGGCGAKVAQGVLDRVLDRLARDSGATLDASIETRGDAAVFTPPAGQRMVQSFDYLRDFLGDPYRLGEIAAQHALNDLYAMGATPHSALVHASVPLAAEKIMEEQLYQLLAGATAAFADAGAMLLGGHSSESTELGIGFAVTGLLDTSAPAHDAPLEPGMALILTKALGTGVLFAADMRHRARGDTIEAAVAQMRQSSAAAAACLHHHETRACTDVTGFGLVGHLDNLLASQSVSATLDLDALPLLPGTAQLAAEGIHSSLYPQNRTAQQTISSSASAQAHPALPLLFDPQTAGGLLAVLPAHRAQACIKALHRAGYPNAVIIGRLTESKTDASCADSAQSAARMSFSTKKTRLSSPLQKKYFD